MKCPYCNKELERGFLKTSHHVHWGKEKELGFNPDDILLTKNNVQTFIKGQFIDSYYCNDCKKIIVSLEDK